MLDGTKCLLRMESVGRAVPSLLISVLIEGNDKSSEYCIDVNNTLLVLYIDKRQNRIMELGSCSLKNSCQVFEKFMSVCSFISYLFSFASYRPRSVDRL